MCGRDRNRKSPFAISGVIIVAHRDHWGTLTFLDKRIRTNRILSSFESSSHKIQINRKKIMTVEKANRYPLNQVVQINHTDIGSSMPRPPGYDSLRRTQQHFYGILAKMHNLNLILRISTKNQIEP